MKDKTLRIDLFLVVALFCCTIISCNQEQNKEMEEPVAVEAVEVVEEKIFVDSKNHISFNGATFGLPLEEFVKGLGLHSIEMLTQVNNKRGYIRDASNLNHCEIKLNAEKWQCDIYSSKSSNTVFRTISVNHYDDLQNNLMLFVKMLEEKYGGEVKEKQDELGEICYWGSYHREMLALYYYAKNANNEIIGEIRIAASPISAKNTESGYIELCYTDYGARDIAYKEYDSIMKNAL